MKRLTKMKEIITFSGSIISIITHKKIRGLIICMQPLYHR